MLVYTIVYQKGTTGPSGMNKFLPLNGIVRISICQPWVKIVQDKPPLTIFSLRGQTFCLAALLLSTDNCFACFVHLGFGGKPLNWILYSYRNKTMPLFLFKEQQ